MSKHRAAITPEMNAVLENMRHKRNDDLLSIAGQLAEAARGLLEIEKSENILIHRGMIDEVQAARKFMKDSLAAWDAAQKGRK